MDGNEVKATRKPRGMRKDKRIQVTYTDGKKPDGSPNRITFYGKTRKEAEAKRDAYKRDREAGLSPSEKETTVAAWIDRWKASYKIDENVYGPYIRRLKDDIGTKPIREVQEADLVQSLNSYSGKSQSGATKYRMIIKRVFHKAQRNHLIADDPSEDLELPDDITEGTHRALETWESDVVLSYWHLHRGGKWAMIMMLCGLRRGELIALDWDAVDLKKRLLTVKASADIQKNQPIVKNQTKSKAGMRVLPICEPLLAMLMDTPEEKRTGPVCLSVGGKRLSKSGFKRGWESYLEAMTRMLNGEPVNQQGRRTDVENSKNDGKQKKPEKVFYCRPHDMRHTYATALYDAGVDLKSAQYYLGHDDISMTQELYTHLSQEREKKSRSTLVNYLDQWLEKHHQNA